MTPVQVAAIIALILGGSAVVLVREPLRQAMVASVYGLLIIVAFLVLQAPDVALSAISVGALAAPMLTVLTLAKVRAHDRAHEHAHEGDGEQ